VCAARTHSVCDVAYTQCVFVAYPQSVCLAFTHITLYLYAWTGLRQSNGAEPAHGPGHNPS
jgi:hypothetical protein